ncbi:unnamed protein product [Symbiodinium sp. KB8]|nr:unnamed protein product [Symbiodinium sp. KB8]
MGRIAALTETYCWIRYSRSSELLHDTSDPELVVVPTGRVASSKGGVVEDVPPAPPLMIEEKLNLLIHLVEQQSNELQKVHHRVAAVEEKLTQLSQAEAPRGALSFISRHSRRLNSKASKAETSMSSKAVSDFNDIDELVGQRVMKAAMKSRQDDNKGGAIYKRSGTYHIGASQNFAASFAMSRKVLEVHFEVAGASSEAGKSKISSKEHCASLRDVFKHRETQLVPVSPTGTTGTSMRVPTGFQQEEEYVPSGYGERGASCFLACCDAWTRLCGLTPLVQQWIENPEEDCEDLDPWMMLVSKAYHCLVLSLSCVGVWATATRLSVCSSGSDIDPCASGPATDVAIAFGATLAIASCGGLRHYFKSAQMQIQINEHLLASVESEGLMSHLRRQKTTDGFVTVLLWIAILAARLGFYSLQPEFNGHLARALVPHAFASAALLGACYLQVACWRGVSLTIVAFARSLLSGHIRGQGARAKWREMTSCMRQASRMYQLSAAALALTAVLVVFTSLFDVHQGLMADILPNLVVAGSLLRSLYVAASATAHCTRLPSFVSMLDGGEEDMELEYMNLSLYLSLSESGFFMWVSVAADFYANEGGSASLLAHGLSQHAASEPRRLWTFEVQADWAASTARSLQAAGADVSLVKPAWSGSAAQEALLKEARGGEPRAAVRAIVVAEAPAFHHDASEEAASEALLQAPCMEKPGIQFAFIDPLEAFVPEFSILFTSCPDLKWIAEVTCPIFLMNDDELQQKIDRLVKLVSENVPESGANETEPADPGQGNLRASREASPKRDEAEHDHSASWLVGMDDIRRIEATSSKATPSSSSKVPSSAVQAVPTSSRRFWGPSLTAAVKANQRRLVASKPAPRQEASHEGEEGRDEFAVSPEARKALASIGRSLETGDLHSWELHNAARGLTRKLLTATVDDAIILEESETWQGIRMGAAVPDLDVRVSLPISRALHAIPEGRAVVGQLVTALVLLRLHGLEPASIGRAKRKATDRLLRQSLSEYMTKKKEKKDKKQKKEKVEKKEKKEKKKAKRADKELDKERTKKAKIASKGAAKAAKVGAGEARPVGSQVGRQDLASLKSEVVRELRQRPMTLQTLNSLFGCRLKEATKSMGQQIKFKKWLLEIDDVKWGGKKGNPLLTWKPTSQTPADKRSRSRSPRRAPDPPPGNFGAALNPQW